MIMDLINKWLIINCNGDWEHEFGVRIISSDVPGWNIELDLSKTCLESTNFSYSEKKEHSFIEINIIDNVFKAYCSLNYYNRCLSLFINELFISRRNRYFEYEAYIGFEYENKIFYTVIKGIITDDFKFKIKEIPDIEVEKLKSSDFNFLIETSFQSDFPSLNLKLDDVLDFELGLLHDGCYPIISYPR
jgi:hypothetical protein